MDVDIVDNNRFGSKRMMIPYKAESNKFMTIDDATHKLENLYINSIVMKYGEYRESILSNRNKLNIAFANDNGILEAEDNLRMHADTLEADKFIKRFKDFEEALVRDRLEIIACNREIENAKTNINGLAVYFANAVYYNYTKIMPNEKDDMVIDVVNRLSMGEGIQDDVRREFTESILDEITIRMKENSHLYKTINEIRGQNMHYFMDKLRKG
ncbi:hypothetical protein Mia14_0312 [Candidatus Mancarchaeum acidiphilum]|uniref:Uncharacterized protein n=1 Tax=Candidatus Mancarchaeum acidiphilum TaxID=1920749 RepID=A0A218NME6_9ARCH|nr:hypothetical protein [Candidatus Mancarchaeum acidiphilum]ASI13639.1 hypothetical protein Mia14_0312 [Candidatus Mancarchaeum acidiphilum]